MYSKWILACRPLAAAFLALAPLTVAAEQNGTASQTCDDKTRGVDICYSAANESTSRGVIRMRGKAHLVVKDLNWVRYRYSLERTNEPAEEVSPLGLFPFIPTTVSAPSVDKSTLTQSCKDGVTTVANFEACTAKFLTDTNEALQLLAGRLEKARSEAEAARSFIASSTARTKKDAVEARITALNLKAVNPPLGQDRLTKLERTRVSLREQGKVLPETTGSPGSKTKAYEYLLAVEQPLEGLAKLDKARQEAKSHITQMLGLLESAKSRLSEGPRHLEATERCTFTTPGRSTYTLVRTDVLAAKGKEGAAENPSKREIVVFECSTRLSVSGGVSFATLDERRYKFVVPPPTPTPAVAALTLGSIAQDTMDGAGEMTTTPNVIALDRFSDFRVVPMVLAHVRVWDNKSWLGIHGTFGAGVETGGDGLDIEFLAGVSFSIGDALFITPGVQIGRVDSLVDGFQVGTPQPMGLSDPPIRRSNATAFGIALSWKFSPSSAGSKSTEKK